MDIGLSKLRLIRNGGVRIAENNKMCYSRYIDWKHIMTGPLNDILVDDAVEIGVGEGKICEFFPKNFLASYNRVLNYLKFASSV
ncbi:hypothetical protein DICVIV_00782 [Dictyocaulus viviparus]|uniref:Receptor L-domain domain-containing protein n=1 Tax=Dictyocaulus viviparus TaxID=29172 RepID=A0A0D8YA64_DICVI|nr:hypothetical protein DICVIV_00782 [Dictyocaulus viviparus]